jgi:hypothetical protein
MKKLILWVLATLLVLCLALTLLRDIYRYG